MVVKKLQRNIETYGKRKDLSSRTRVLGFCGVLIIFVIALTLARSSVLTSSATDSVVNSEEAKTEKSNSGLVIEKTENGVSITRAVPISFDINSLAENELVASLPKEAVIFLQLGNEDYTIRRSSIARGAPSSPDILIKLPSSSLADLSNGLCSAVQNAENNGQLVIETYLSDSSLMWKYRSMLKYKNCLGL